MALSMHRVTLKSEIEKILGIYEIGGLPTVLTHGRNSQLVAVHENTHLLDVNTTLFGYCLRRCNEIGRLPGAAKPSPVSTSIANSWSVFEGHATYLEYICLRLFHDENAYKAWFDDLPSDYKEAFVLFSNLFLPHIDRSLGDRKGDNRQHEFMYLQALSRGVATGLLDYRFARAFRDLDTWLKLRDRFLEAKPDEFLKSNYQRISLIVADCIDHISSLYRTAYFKANASPAEIDDDFVLVSRSAKAYVWSGAAGGDFNCAVNPDTQIEALKRIDVDLTTQEPRLTRSTFFTHKSNTFVASDLRTLDIERNVKVVSLKGIDTAVSAIKVAQRRKDYLKSVVTLDQLAPDGTYFAGVHNYVLSPQKRSFVFDSPITYVTNVSADDVARLCPPSTASVPSVSGGSDSLVFVSTHGLTSQHATIGSFVESQSAMQSPFPRYVWLPVFDLDFISKSDFTAAGGAGLEYCVIKGDAGQVEVAYLRADKYRAFWVGAGLFHPEHSDQNQITGGHLFKPFDINEDLNLAACVMTITHSYSAIMARLMYG